jgi:hypothetical protein
VAEIFHMLTKSIDYKSALEELAQVKVIEPVVKIGTLKPRLCRAWLAVGHSVFV